MNWNRLLKLGWFAAGFVVALLAVALVNGSALHSQEKGKDKQPPPKAPFDRWGRPYPHRWASPRSFRWASISAMKRSAKASGENCRNFSDDR